MPFGIAAPIIAGWSFDQTGSYQIVFTIWAGFMPASAVTMSFARRPVLASLADGSARVASP